MEKAFRADLIVENLVLIDLNSVEEMHRKFKKITLSYIRLASLELGLLINFGEELLTKGITRLINDYKGAY
ncbi:MAG: GxxExxY protein [Saprospiraceae bacterium]|jgi:GxxExxY protein